MNDRPTIENWMVMQVTDTAITPVIIYNTPEEADGYVRSRPGRTLFVMPVQRVLNRSPYPAHGNAPPINKIKLTPVWCETAGATLSGARYAISKLTRDLMAVKDDVGKSSGVDAGYLYENLYGMIKYLIDAENECRDAQALIRCIAKKQEEDHVQ